MKINDVSLISEIKKLKKEKNAILLAHNYQVPPIQDVADFLGDSLELAKKSMGVKEKTIVFCGVQFMAETAKILSPEKTVLLPVREAGCPLADMVTESELLELKSKHPDAWVVSYVNTPASIKALSDVCCTSANAVSVVRNVPSKKIIFTPDKNLAWWVQKNIPEKEIISWKGFCLVHEYFSLNDVKQVRKIYPEAEIIVHPECRSEVIEAADHIVSTSGMLRRAKESHASIMIIGTEEGMIYRLNKENPGKTFYSLGTVKTCVNMKKTALCDVVSALRDNKFKIELEKNIMDKARKALERMVEYV
jgi:quinolinate synthase